MNPPSDLCARKSRQAYDALFTRKGSIAAFIAALRCYDAAAPDSSESAQAAADVAGLLPAMLALGVLDVFSLKSARARTLLRSLDPSLPV